MPIQDEIKAHLAKNEEMCELLLKERQVHETAIAEIDVMLAQLRGGKPKRTYSRRIVSAAQHRTVVSSSNGTSQPDSETETSAKEDGGSKEDVPLDELDENEVREAPKTQQLLFFVRKRGEVSRKDIMAFFPHNTAEERQRTYTLIYQAIRSKKLREKPNGMIVIVMP